MIHPFHNLFCAMHCKEAVFKEAGERREERERGTEGGRERERERNLGTTQHTLNLSLMLLLYIPFKHF